MIPTDYTPPPDLNLSGRVAIVTGAGRGVGAAIARALAAAGARIAVNDINPDRAARVAAEIRRQGGQAIDVTADVSSKFQCVNLIETTRAEWERLDILVTAASVEPRVPILKMDEWEWARCLDVNLKGPFFMSQLVGRVMADENKERGGVIVNVGAAPGDAAGEPAGRAAYLASKAGLQAFSAACAREFADFGVSVNVVLPGAAEETARAVLFLCSEAGRRLTGRVIAANGDTGAA